METPTATLLFVTSPGRLGVGEVEQPTRADAYAERFVTDASIASEALLETQRATVSSTETPALLPATVFGCFSYYF